MSPERADPPQGGSGGLVSGPEPRPIASTLDLRHDLFSQRVSPLRPAGEPATVRLQLRLLRRILVAAARGRQLILYSSRGSLKPDLIACVLLGLMPRRHRPPTVLVGEMWQPGIGPQAVAERLVVRLADRAVDRYLVPSQAEAEVFPLSWPVDAAKVRAVLFYFDPAEHGLGPDDPVAPLGDHVMAGGDSFRDYGPLIEAARCRPDVPFLLITKVVEPDGLPPNVSVKAAKYTDYVTLLRGAGVVAVPVRTGLKRSAGILTFLMAMHLGRPTVVTRALAVDEYVEDGESGLIVDGTVEDWLRAIDGLRADPDRAVRLAAVGRAAVRERFTFDDYVRGLLVELDAVVAERYPHSPKCATDDPCPDH